MRRVPTKRQIEAYEAIRSLRDERGHLPNYREIGARLKISVHAVATLICALERSGWLRRGGGARSLRLLHNPSPSLEFCGEVW